MVWDGQMLVDLYSPLANQLNVMIHVNIKCHRILEFNKKCYKKKAAKWKQNRHGKWKWNGMAVEAF